MIARLKARPGRFDLFQAVRLLELEAVAGAARDEPGARPVGYDAAPDEEAVRFALDPSLAFRGATVVELRSAGADEGRGKQAARRPPVLRVSALGLIGSVGVLPQSYAELVVRRLYFRDRSARDFLDIFHHRALSLLYRAWRKYRLPIAYEHARRLARRPSPQEDHFTLALRSLVGRGTPHLGAERALGLRPWLYYAGHFAGKQRSAAALEGMLTEALGVDVRLEQLVGRWLQVGPRDRTRLPLRGQLQGWNNRLGTEAVLGDRVWDLQSKIRLRLGPMSSARFRAFLPGGRGLAALRALADSFLDAQTDYEITCELDPGAPQPMRLASRAQDGARLGWNTWLGARDLLAMARTVVLALDRTSPPG